MDIPPQDITWAEIRGWIENREPIIRLTIASSVYVRPDPNYFVRLI